MKRKKGDVEWREKLRERTGERQRCCVVSKEQTGCVNWVGEQSQSQVTRKGCFHHGRYVVRSKYVTIVCGPWRYASCRDEVKSLKKRLLGMPSEREGGI